LLVESRSCSSTATRVRKSASSSSYPSTTLSTQNNAAIQRERTFGPRSAVENLKAEPPRTPMDATEREKLMKDGRCFYCKDRGHIATDCPRKGRTTEVKALEDSKAGSEEGQWLKDRP
jgi:Zinc knuckle